MVDLWRAVCGLCKKSTAGTATGQRRGRCGVRVRPDGLLSGDVDEWVLWQLNGLDLPVGVRSASVLVARPASQPRCWRPADQRLSLLCEILLLPRAREHALVHGRQWHRIEADAESDVEVGHGVGTYTYGNLTFGGQRDRYILRYRRRCLCRGLDVADRARRLPSSRCSICACTIVRYPDRPPE